MTEEEDEKQISEDMNPDALEAALGDDFEVDDEVSVYSFSEDDEKDLDVAFTDNDSRDWY